MARSLIYQSALFLCALLAPASLGWSQELSRHPYLQLATQNSITIVWRTTGETTPAVRYGPAPDQLVNQLPSNQIIIRLGPDVPGPPELPRLHSASPNNYQFEATITGLQPGITYYYGVFDDADLLAGADNDHRFTTLPATGSAASLRLWVTGDTGKGSGAQKKAFQEMLDYAANDGRQVDAYLHLGDMAYGTGLDWQFTLKHFEIYSELIRNTVTWPTMGNHEAFTSSGRTGIGPYYDAFVMPTGAEAGGTPSGTEAYYSFDIGSVHFICLDSHDLNRTPSGEMALWLKADLEATQASWLIAFWHHPPYSKGTHDSDNELQLIEMREFIMPILESSGVDLVLTGHSHVYERSMLLDGAYATPTTVDGVVLDDGDGLPQGDGPYRKSTDLTPNEGTVAVVAGNGQSAGSYYGTSPVMRTTLQLVGSVIIDIDGDTLSSRMIDRSGAIHDEFRIIKSGTLPPPEPLAYPWRPRGPSFAVERFAPDETKIEILPVPAAPDANVHFEVGGAEPTLASSIYTVPLPYNDSPSVRAFSTWSSGQRSSPSTSSSQIPEHISLFRHPASGGDDGFESQDGSVDLDRNVLTIGGGGITAIRYTDIRIPSGAAIVSAYLQFSKNPASQALLTEGIIHGELSPDSAPFAETDFNLSARSKTVAQTAWRLASWLGNATRDDSTTSPNLVDIVDEIVAQTGWGSGNSISILLNHAGGPRDAYSFEHSKAQTPTLSITYIDPEGLGEDLANQTLTMAESPASDYHIQFRWPRAEFVEQLGVSFELEMSTDLSTWIGVEPAAEGIISSSADGFTTRFAEIDSAAFVGNPRLFFRLTVSQDPTP